MSSNPRRLPPGDNDRDTLMHTAAEEIGHIEMLTMAVALILEKAPTVLQEKGAGDGIAGAVMAAAMRATPS